MIKRYNKQKQCMCKKIVPLSHHFQPTRSVWQKHYNTESQTSLTSLEKAGKPRGNPFRHGQNVRTSQSMTSLFPVWIKHQHLQFSVNLWFCFILWKNNIGMPQHRDSVCVCVCACPHLGHASGIKAEDPLVAAGVDPCAVPAPLCTHARIQHTIWVVLTMGQLCTQEHLYTDTGEGKQWLLCASGYLLILTEDNSWLMLHI